MKLNVEKTQLLLLSRKWRAQELESVEIRMDGQKIVRSKTVKCLGVLSDDGLTWKEQVQRSQAADLLFKISAKFVIGTRTVLKGIGIRGGGARGAVAPPSQPLGRLGLPSLTVFTGASVACTTG